MNALKAALPTDVLVQSNATTNSVIVTGNVEQLDRAKELVHSLQAQFLCANEIYQGLSTPICRSDRGRPSPNCLAALEATSSVTSRPVGRGYWNGYGARSCLGVRKKPLMSRHNLRSRNASLSSRAHQRHDFSAGGAAHVAAG